MTKTLTPKSTSTATHAKVLKKQDNHTKDNMKKDTAKDTAKVGAIKENRILELFLHYGEAKLVKMRECVSSLYTELVDEGMKTAWDGYFINTDTDGCVTLISALGALYENKEIYEFAWVDDETLYLKNVKNGKLLQFSAKDSMSNLVFINKKWYELLQREQEYVKDSNAIQPFREVVEEVKGTTHRIGGSELQMFYKHNKPVLLGDRVLCGHFRALASVHNIEVKYYYGGTYNMPWYCLPEGWVAHVTLKYPWCGKTRTELVPVGTPVGPSLAEKNEKLYALPKQNFLPKEFTFCNRAMNDMDTRKSDDLEFREHMGYWYCPYIMSSKLHGVSLMPLKKGDIVTRLSEHHNLNTYKIKKVIDGRGVMLQKIHCEGVLVPKKELYFAQISDLRKK